MSLQAVTASTSPCRPGSCMVGKDMTEPRATEDTHMVDPPPYPDTGDDTGVGPDRGSTTSAPRYPGMPRWVKASGIVVLVLVASGSQHGPGRHMPSGAPGGPGGHTPPAAQAVQQA